MEGREERESDKLSEGRKDKGKEGEEMGKER